MVLISSIISVAHKGGAIIADAAIGPGSDDVKGGGDRKLNSPPIGICGKFIDMLVRLFKLSKKKKKV